MGKTREESNRAELVVVQQQQQEEKRRKRRSKKRGGGGEREGGIRKPLIIYTDITPKVILTDPCNFMCLVQTLTGGHSSSSSSSSSPSSSSSSCVGVGNGSSLASEEGMPSLESPLPPQREGERLTRASSCTDSDLLSVADYPVDDKNNNNNNNSSSNNNNDDDDDNDEDVDTDQTCNGIFSGCFKSLNWPPPLDELPDWPLLSMSPDVMLFFDDNDTDNNILASF